MKLRTLLLFVAATFALQLAAQDELTKENAQRHYAEFKKYFTDGSCSELAIPYSAMTDEQLLTALGDTPKELVNIALKVKNDAWATREKEFRVAEYEPHSNVSRWADRLKTYQYSYINNPTGITADKGDTLLIFIDADLQSSSRMKLVEINNNEAWSNYLEHDAEKFLYPGLNLVTVAQSDVTLFITYVVTTDTTSTSATLADNPNAKIHIEGGEVNGYFDKKRHTDEDWRDMLANHFKHYSVQVKGERVLFHMVRENIAKVCPNTITDAIGWWDQCVQWQHELMGADKYHDRWNNLLMARDGYEDMYMYANMNYTYYEYYTLQDILPWATVYESPGKMWGPPHEIGHINQGAINIVSCTEASNNLFSNVQLFNVGKSTTRGVGVADCVNDFNNGVSYPERGNVIGKSRMFFQLFLYFHAAGKDKTFYPRLFDALRADPLQKGERDANMVYQTYGIDDQLKFAEKCCEVAQMDLSEFFEAWGFFVPMTNVHIGDYGNYNVNMTKEEAEASRARMQKYEKKGGHLIFIEDRIKPSKRTDGVDGYKIDYNEEFVVGEMGETGQWEDYIDESVKAEGYFYSLIGNIIYIKETENAKGALGFKIYDADSGELLTFSNTLNINIPSYANKNSLRVVAAQADGTDRTLKNVTESDDEEMQKLALEAELPTIRLIIKGATKDGQYIGRFYKQYVNELNELYTAASAANKNNDTSLHSYREWRMLLSEALERLKKIPGSRAEMLELDVYEVTNIGETGYMLCNDKMGIKGTYEYDVDGIFWLVEKADEEGCFYIKNKDGKYINDVTLNLGAMCSGSKEDAVAFRINYNDYGYTYFTTKESGLYLAMNSEQKAVGSNVLRDNALWSVRRVENNTAVVEVEQDGNDADVIYDLHGRYVENPGRGIYIINGKLKINR